jgi:hypothetical protein
VSLTTPVVVPGRPSSTGLTWWILTDGGPPSLELLPRPATADIVLHDLRRAGDPLGTLGAYAVATRGLQPDTRYNLRVRQPDRRGQQAFSRTLPDLTGGGPFRFTIAVASCYSSHTDRREIGRSYPPPMHEPTGPEPDPIRLRFLIGDQLYMDLEPFGEFINPRSQPPDPIARYLFEWTHPKYAPFLSRSPTLTLADDHEFWNDYPNGFPQPQISWAWTVGGAAGDLARRLRRAFRLFQAPLNLDPADIRDDAAAMDALLERPALSPRVDVDPLSFFRLDSRLSRQVWSQDGRARVIDPASLADCRTWLQSGDGPAILVLAPVFADPPKSFPMVLFDKNLSNYSTDYAELAALVFEALAHRHVIVLGGDIHVSRVCRIERQPPTPFMLHEVVASPLSLIRSPPDIEDILPIPSTPDEGEIKLPHLLATRRVLDGDPGVGERRITSTIAQQSFTTISFRCGGTWPAAPVETAVRAWAPPVRLTTFAPALLYQTTFLLRGTP